MNKHRFFFIGKCKNILDHQKKPGSNTGYTGDMYKGTQGGGKGKVKTYQPNTTPTKPHLQFKRTKC